MSQERIVRLDFGGIQVTYEALSETNYDSLTVGSYHEAAWMSGVIHTVIKPGYTVADVGAHTGLWTLPAAVRVGELGHVYAFEPEGTTRKGLERNLELNGISNVSVSSLAIAANSEQRPFFVRGETEMHSFYTTSMRPHADPSNIIIQTARLDALVQSNAIRQPDFVKIDVEGAEIEVLCGLEQIAREITAILIEVHEQPLISLGHNEGDVERLLNHYGFQHIQRLGAIHLLATRWALDARPLDPAIVVGL